MVDQLLVLFCEKKGHASFRSFGQTFPFLSRGVQTFGGVPNGLRKSAG